MTGIDIALRKDLYEKFRVYAVLILINVVIIGMINILGMGQYVLQMYLVIITILFPVIVARRVIDRRNIKRKRAYFVKLLQAFNLSDWAFDLYHKGKFDEAVNVLHEALEVSPNNPYVYEVLGQMYAEEGGIQNAIAYFNESIAIDEKRPKAHLGLARAYHKVGLLELANGEYDRAIELTDDRGLMSCILVLRSETSLALSNYERALKELEEAAELNSDSPAYQKWIIGEIEFLKRSVRAITSTGLLN